MRAHTKKRLMILPVSLIIALVCTGFRDMAPVVFSHRVHRAFEARGGAPLSCEECHDTTRKNGPPTLKETFCDRCHDDQGTPPWVLPNRSRKISEVSFNHALHAKSQYCQGCHRATTREAHKNNRPLVRAEQCLACHSKDTAVKRISERACTTCHQTAKNRVAPSSHKKSWLVRHGPLSKWERVSDHGRQCRLCHGNAACVTCHRTRRPRDHTGLWRIRLHGKASSWDRERCKTCHETGACVSCHRRTPPQSHRGAWEAMHGLAARTGMDTSCTTCHRRAWCSDCHRRGNR